MQNEKIKIEGSNFCLTSDAATEFNQNKRYSKRAAMDLFIEYCSSNKIEDAFCQTDKNEKGQSKEGITVYGIKLKDKKLMTIYLHENEYANCKDEMQQLSNAVKRAIEKKNRRKQIKERITLIAGTAALATLFASAIVIQNGPGTKVKKESTTVVIEDPVIDINSTEEVPEIINDEQIMIDNINEIRRQEFEEYRQNQIEREQNINQSQSSSQTSIDYSNLSMQELMNEYRSFEGSDTVIPIEQYQQGQELKK